MSRWARRGMLLPAALLAACSQAEPQKAPEVVRPVLSVLVEPQAGSAQGFAGTVEPQFSANLSFRLLGKVVARDVDVGDRVARGVTIAALDPTALDLAVQRQGRSFPMPRRRRQASASEERHGSFLPPPMSPGPSTTPPDSQPSAGRQISSAPGRPLPRSEDQLGLYPACSADFDAIVTAVGAEVALRFSPGQLW